MKSFSILDFICNGKSVLIFSKEQVEKLMGHSANIVSNVREGYNITVKLTCTRNNYRSLIFTVTTTKYSLDANFFEPRRSYLFSNGSRWYVCFNATDVIITKSDHEDKILTSNGELLARMIFLNNNILKIGKIPLE